jgi:ribosomal-protein-alanine N-acetyltransferase
MKTEGMIFREANLEDAEELKRLDELCFSRQVQYDELQFLYYITDSDIHSLVIDHNKRLIGFIIYSTDKTAQTANIVTLDIHPDFRRKGLATKLLDTAESQLDKIRTKTITLQVSVNNMPAQNFYKAKGYEIQSVINDYYPSEDAYVMAKRLP